jgi:CheY-like chemotaxis protein
MSSLFMSECLPADVGDSDTYNRIQMCRAIQSRGDPTAESPITASEELMRVLILDDNRALAYTVSKLVGIWGHEVKQAYDGNTALALANTYQPDVLLLDLVMSEMSGLEVSRRMRQQAHLRKCFIVVVTGCTDASLWPLCHKAGVDLILIKPVAPSILKTLLIWEAEYVHRSRHAPASVTETAVLAALDCHRDSGVSLVAN